MGKRIHLAVVALLVAVVLIHVLSTEAKKEKEKQKYKQEKYVKAEGSPKEAKYKYSKQSQDKQHKSKKYREVPVEPEESEVLEQEEAVEYKPPSVKVSKTVKPKKAIIVEEEQPEEPIVETKQKNKLKPSSWVRSPEDPDVLIPVYKVQKQPEQKRQKKTVQGDQPDTVTGKAGNPKRILVRREAIILEEENVPEDEGIAAENAMQTYIVEEDNSDLPVQEEEEEPKCYYTNESNP